MLTNERKRPDRLWRILIHLPAIGYFRTVLSIAKTIQRSGIGEAVVFAAHRFPGYEDLQRQIDEAGVKMFCPRNAAKKLKVRELPAAIEALGFEVTRKRRPHRTIDVHRARRDYWCWIRLALVRMVARSTWKATHEPEFTRWQTRHATIADQADLIIDALDIDVFITCNETINYNSHLFVASMRAVGRRSLYLPNSIPSLNEMNGRLLQNTDVHVVDLCQRIAARLFPKWVRKVFGFSLFRAPLGRILSTERDHVAPHDPWLSFTMGSDAVGISSPFLMDRLLEMGAAYRRRSMFLTGSHEDDAHNRLPAKVNAVRADIAAQSGWDVDTPIVLFSPPANLTTQYALPEFDSYHDLLEYWSRTLSGLRNFNVLISPHPWFELNPDSYAVLKASGLKISPRGLADLIPAVDVLATFGASSTPRLAASMGKPVLNYLCFDANFPPEDNHSYFVGFDSMPVASTRVEWEALLDRLDDRDCFEDLVDLAKCNASYFGMQDGDFATRLATMVDTLATGTGPLSDAELKRLAQELPGPSQITLT